MQCCMKQEVDQGKIRKPIEKERAMVDASPEESLFHNFIKEQLQKMKAARKDAGMGQNPTFRW